VFADSRDKICHVRKMPHNYHDTQVSREIECARNLPIDASRQTGMQPSLHLFVLSTLLLLHLEAHFSHPTPTPRSNADVSHNFDRAKSLWIDGIVRTVDRDRVAKHAVWSMGAGQLIAIQVRTRNMPTQTRKLQTIARLCASSPKLRVTMSHQHFDSQQRKDEQSRK
jgi:hypothetical protein